MRSLRRKAINNNAHSKDTGHLLSTGFYFHPSQRTDLVQVNILVEPKEIRVSVWTLGFQLLNISECDSPERQGVKSFRPAPGNWRNTLTQELWWLLTLNLDLGCHWDRHSHNYEQILLPEGSSSSFSTRCYLVLIKKFSVDNLQSHYEILVYCIFKMNSVHFYSYISHTLLVKWLQENWTSMAWPELQHQRMMAAETNNKKKFMPSRLLMYCPSWQTQ